MFRLLHRLIRLKTMRSRFFIWVIIFIYVTSSLFVISFIVIDKNKRIEDTEESLKYGLINQKMLLENWAEERAEEIRLLASFLVSKDLNLKKMAERFQYYHHYYEQLNALVFVDAEGFVKIDTALDNLLISDPKISLKDRDYFIAAKEGKEHMYDVIHSKTSGEPTIIFSSPIRSESKEFQGVLFGAVHLEKINDILSQSIQGKTGEITLINHEGSIISHLSKADHAYPKQLTKNQNHFQRVYDQKEDFATYKNIHGQEVYGAFIPIFDGRFFLINEIEKSEVLKPHHQMITVMLIITLITILIVFALILPISKRLLQPFYQILRAIHQMKEGNYRTQLELDQFSKTPVELQEIVHAFNEMSKAIHHNKKMLQRLSHTDGLTGIANRRLFDEQLEKMWNVAKEEKKPISLIFTDIDYFKQYNDRFGHQKGDECLIKIARAMDRLFDSSKDLVARYGGEEFVVILPGKNQTEAKQIAEEIRTAIKALRIKRSLDQDDRFVTLSIGIATMIPTSSYEKETLVQLADQALYEAKRSGRNRIVFKEKGI